MNKKRWMLITAIAMTFSLCACDLIPNGKPDSVDQPTITDIIVKEQEDEIDDGNDDIDTNIVIPDDGDDEEDGNEGEGEEENGGDETGLFYYPEDAAYSISLKTQQYEVYELMEASEAYFEFLEKEAEEYNQSTGFDDGLERVTFNFVDMNGDNLLELAYSFNGSHAYGVRLATYDMEKGEVVPWGEIGSYGNAIVYAGCNMAISGYSGMGYTYVSFITFDDNNMARSLVEFENDEWAVEDAADAVFTINGEEVSSEEYDRVYEMWRSYYSQYYRILDFTYMIPYYDGEVNFDCFSYPFEREPEDYQLALDNYEIVLSQMGYPAFSLVYIDGDNVPELVMADGNGAENGVYVFCYSFSEGVSICFGQYGLFGSMSYIDGTGLLVQNTTLGGSKIFYMSDIAVVPINSFEDTEVLLGENGDNNYKMNGMFVDKETYMKYRKSWEEVDYSTISYDSMVKDYSADEIPDLFSKIN